MQCQLCSFSSLNDKSIALEKLKEHYIYGHLVSYNNPHLEQLCDIQFKKTDNTARINLQESGPTKYFSNNFNQHKHLFHFFNENIVADFLKTVHEVFEPNGINRYKFYGCVEIINFDAGQETNEIFFRSDHNSKYFSGYIKTEIGHQMIEKVVGNCKFKRFNRLRVIISQIK